MESDHTASFLSMIYTRKVPSHIIMSHKNFCAIFFFLPEHRYHAQNMGPEHWHVIVYEPGKRTDELCKREAGKTFLKNHYQDRSDKKKFTGFTFGPRGKITERLALPSSRPIEVRSNIQNVTLRKFILFVMSGLGTGVGKYFQDLAPRQVLQEHRLS